MYILLSERMKIYPDILREQPDNKRNAEMAEFKSVYVCALCLFMSIFISLNTCYCMCCWFVQWPPLCYMSENKWIYLGFYLSSGFVVSCCLRAFECKCVFLLIVCHHVNNASSALALYADMYSDVRGQAPEWHHNVLACTLLNLHEHQSGFHLEYY